MSTQVGQGISAIVALRLAAGALMLVVVGAALCLSSPLRAQESGPPVEDPRVTMARVQCRLDLNGDGKCGAEDTRLLTYAIGACEGETDYAELADVDHDGCVTRADQEEVFPMFVRDNRYEFCDLDRDGDCDRDDWNIYVRSVPMCFDNEPKWNRGSTFRLAYNPLADANRDGCVSANDQEVLFPGLEDPRVTVAREQCRLDLNGDGRCGAGDTARLSRVIGACEGETNYSELADVDHDGCVTRADQEELFPMFVRDDRYEPCDLDRDGDCDRDDWNIYLRSIHSCFDGSPTLMGGGVSYGYNPLADVDRDGCVLGGDEEMLFPVVPQEKSPKTQ